MYVIFQLYNLIENLFVSNGAAAIKWQKVLVIIRVLPIRKIKNICLLNSLKFEYCCIFVIYHGNKKIVLGFGLQDGQKLGVWRHRFGKNVVGLLMYHWCIFLYSSIIHWSLIIISTVSFSPQRIVKTRTTNCSNQGWMNLLTVRGHNKSKFKNVFRWQLMLISLIFKIVT